MVKRKKVKKKVIKKAAPKKDPVYVQLPDPVGFRRTILQTAISAAKLIQSYEVLRALKKEKVSVISELGKVITETKKIGAKLMGGSLPKVKEEPKPKVKEEKYTPAPVVHKEPVKAAPKPVVTKHLSDVEKLQQELGEIEGKLAKL